MGALAPAPLSAAALAAVETQILAPTLAGLARDGVRYRGCLYLGLMLTAAGPRLLEYNVRLGDPETQALLPLVDDDLGELLAACAAGRLRGRRPRLHPGTAVCVVLAAPGYPEAPVSGAPIAGLAAAADAALVFHAGTRRDPDGVLRVAGGRVLGLVGVAADLAAAADAAHRAADLVTFAGVQRRRDIGRCPPASRS
jgi:phosphoribosylamine--glycine ligase